MEFKSIDSYESRRTDNDERRARLSQLSNQFVDNSKEILERIDNGLITEEEMMRYDPDMSGMTQYGSSGVVHGSNVTNTTQTIQYSQQPQNDYSYQAQRPNVDSTMYNLYQQQQPISYQPQTNYAYNGYYSQTTPTTNLYAYSYNPQMIQYSPGLMYNNPYGLDPRNYSSEEEMVEEYNRLEEERKKACNTNVALAMYFRDFSEVAGADFVETREEYQKKIENQYGYKTFAQMKVEREEYENKLKEEREKQFRSSDVNNGELKIKFISCIVDENGNRKIMSKGINPETGERTIVYTKRDLEIDNFNRMHFWDIYAKDANWTYNFTRAINNRVKEYKNKYDSYTWEELTGPEAKMCDYYDDVVTKQDSNKLKATLMKGRWSNGTSYTNNFWHSGVSTDINFNNMSRAFRTDYELAKQIHSANLSKTPDEIEISSVLNNSLRRDYDAKRAMFINKMLSGNPRTNMAANARQTEVIAAPNINNIMEAEAISYLNEQEELEKRKQEALLRNDNLDPTGGHIISKTEISNPGCIGGTNIPILNRTIVHGVMSDEETQREFNNSSVYYDIDNNKIIGIGDE